MSGFMTSGSMSGSTQIDGTWKADGAKLYVQITQPYAAFVDKTMSFSAVTSTLQQTSDTTWTGSLNGEAAELRLTGNSFTLIMNADTGVEGFSGNAVLSGTRSGDTLMITDAEIVMEIAIDYVINGSYLTLDIEGDSLTLTK